MRLFSKLLYSLVPLTVFISQPAWCERSTTTPEKAHEDPASVLKDNAKDLHSSDANKKKKSFSNVTEFGLVQATGNSKTDTVNLDQKNSFSWKTHELFFSGNFLNTESNGALSARVWGLGIRFEEDLSHCATGFVGESIESNVFTGFLQRYNTDLGTRLTLKKTKEFSWSTELGGRYILENYTSGEHRSLASLRFFTEASYSLSTLATGKLWVELIPTLRDLSNFRFNSELSVKSRISQIFSLKAAYLVRYLNQLIPGQTVNTDTVFTTSLVAEI